MHWRSLVEYVTPLGTQPRSPGGPSRLLGMAAPEASISKFTASCAGLTHRLLASSTSHLHTLSGGAATLGEPGP